MDVFTQCVYSGKTMKPEIVDMVGNKDLLGLPKTAFLCSRRIPAAAVLKCYDWAIAERDRGRCMGRDRAVVKKLRNF
jgi:hypothetical protein